jgi:hypothetical protein
MCGTSSSLPLLLPMLPPKPTALGGISMFSLRFISNGSHTLIAGEELVEWEAVKNHGSSARVAATLGSAMLLLIGIPSLYLLYEVPHPQKIRRYQK